MSLEDIQSLLEANTTVLEKLQTKIDKQNASLEKLELRTDDIYDRVKHLEIYSKACPEITASSTSFIHDIGCGTSQAASNPTFQDVEVALAPTGNDRKFLAYGSCIY